MRGPYQTMHGAPFLYGEPVKLEWAGWETDTYRLQQAGWALSADQDMMRNMMQIGIHHERWGAYGVTGIAYDWHYRDPDFMRRMRHPMGMRIGKDVHIHHTGDLRPLSAIDAMPQMRPERITRLEELAHFAPSLVRTQQIILPEETVPELMEKILKLQQPEREKIIRNDMGERLTAEPRQKFHAQILSLVA